MKRNIRAVFENGVLRPTLPLNLAEGVEVDVVVMDRPLESEAPALAKTLSGIAAMPMEVDDDGFSGADHDQVLYGLRNEP